MPARSAPPTPPTPPAAADRSDPADPAADADESAAQAALYLERVRALTPLLAASGEEIERERRIPAELQRALVEAGLFRLFLPRSQGGPEVHPLTFVRVVEAIAAVEASPAWNVCQNAVCALISAYLEPAVAREVFGPADAILAWGPPDPRAQAVASDGGYRVTGRWSFASGGRHATWLGGYSPVHEADGTPRRTAKGTPMFRVMLFRAADVEMEDVWRVMGLKGTASDAFSVQDAFVPHAYSVMRDDVSENREAGWLYCFKTTNLYSCGFAGIALGVARSMLDALVRLASEKTPRGYPNPMRENAATQADVGHAEAQLRAARAYLTQTIAEVCAEVQQRPELTMEQRMRIRLAATHVIREAVAVGDFAYEAAGATAIFEANSFERRFRDLHTIVQQLQGRKSHYQTVGKFLFGLDVETMFL
jgi:alkylation response protein AidB-like acyl-CoA dehydrogenase